MEAGKAAADGVLAFQGLNKPSVETLRHAQSAILGIRGYLGVLLKEKKHHPGEDLLSELAAAESEGDKLSETELVNSCITLLVAGHETTTSLIGNGIWALLRYSDQWQLLKNDPSLMKVDTEMGGKTLRQGEMVFQMLNAANRDPAYFTDPDTFDVRRQKNRHIAFGLGVHFCVGALLARTEGQVVFSTLVKRLHNIRLVDDKPDWDVHKPNSRMLRTLHVLV